MEETSKQKTLSLFVGNISPETTESDLLNLFVRIPEQSGPGFRTKLGHPDGAKWATN